MTSDEWFNQLTVAEQDVILHAASAAGKYATSLVLTAENDIEAKLTAAGVSISNPPVEPFMQATESVYQALGYSELRQQVRTLLDEGNGQ